MNKLDKQKVYKLLFDYHDLVNSTHEVVDFNNAIAHIFNRLESGDYDCE